MMKSLAAAAVFTFLAVASLGYRASASPQMSFCESDCAPGTCSRECNYGVIENNASVTVTNVKVRQIGDSTCQEVQQTHHANITWPWSFNFKVDSACTYHIKFNTTDGCVGDKDAKISRDDMANERTRVVLNGACGTLKAKPRKYQYFNGNATGVPSAQ